jgi:hypothetical protein
MITTDTKPSVADRLRAAKQELIDAATDYAEHGDQPEAQWRDICRAKATIDALRRCAR